MKINVTARRPATSQFADTHRFYINKKGVQTADHIYPTLETIYCGNVTPALKEATTKGIEHVFRAGNFSLAQKTTERTKESLLNEFALPRNYDGDVLLNLLSIKGHEQGTYKLLIGNNIFTDGKNGGQIGSAAAINTYGNALTQEMLVAHELGHMFKAATGKHRDNIHQCIGSHCFDNKESYNNSIRTIIKTPCIMRQEITHEHFNTLSSIGAIFCPDCAKDIRNYVLKQ